MQKMFKTRPHTILLICSVMLTTAVLATEEAVKLMGYDQIIADINQQNRHALKKLDGKKYHLSVVATEGTSYDLSLFPTELFEVKKRGQNLFEVTVIEPLSLWKKHKKEPFQIKWVLDEIVKY